MKRIIGMFVLSFFVFSCQKSQSKPKHLSAVSELKDKEEIKETAPKGDDLSVTIDLPNNQYVIIALDSFKDKDNSEDEILYKPKSIKAFDSKSKNEIPEKFVVGIFYSKDGNVWYGDFNFDGKMDVACKGRYSGYRDFYDYNVYLATNNGYKFSKDFSEITEGAIATIELDAQNKKITATRDAEYDQTWVYEVKNGKIKLISDETIDRHVEDEEDAPGN